MSSASSKTAAERAVLVLDDESGIVNAIRRELSTPPLGKHRYVVEGFTSPYEALARAREKQFDVVLTDYRMPEMDGVEFLRQMLAIQSEVSCIVLSGQTDMDALVAMINTIHIYRFIPKPWSSFFLKGSIAQAIDYSITRRRNRALAKAIGEQSAYIPSDSAPDVEHILVVDDQLEVANAIVRELSDKGRWDEVCSAVGFPVSHAAAEISSHRISVQAVQSPIKALQLADQIRFACVIADYRMPQMDGVNFLYEFAEKQPDSVRIMLSGAAGLDEVVSALDLGRIQYFLAKPWQDYELRAAVAEGLNQRRLDMENAVLAEMCNERGIETATQ